ncbi:MAG: tetratricopeptide repeat protein [Actinomycetota bacterium]
MRGVVEVLGKGASQGALFLDDLQWSDEASVDIISSLARRLDRYRVLLIATWRSDEVPTGHRLRRLLAGCERAGNGALIELGRLDEVDVTELVSRSSVELGDDETMVARRLFEETEGVPLFLVEYLAAVRTSGKLEPTLSLGVRRLLESRVEGLPETERQLLTTAAAIGRSFDFEIAQEVSGRSEDECVAAVEGLLDRGLIEEKAEGSSRSRLIYDFRHDKLREFAYDGTSLARRRLLHKRLAVTLERRLRKTRDGSLYAVVANHLLRAGEETRAAQLFGLAGNHAKGLFANGEAIDHFATALALGHPDEAGMREAMGDVQLLNGDYRAALLSYEAAAARKAGRGLAVLGGKLGNLHHRKGDWAAAAVHYEAGLEALAGGDERSERARILADLSLTRQRQGETSSARELAAQALGEAERAGDARSRAQAHNILGVLARNEGHLEAAEDHLQRSLQLASELSDPTARIAALNNLALVSSARGTLGQAEALTTRALEQCRIQGDRHREAALRNNLADILHAAKRPDEAMAHLKAAVAIFAEVGEPDALEPEIWKLAEW